MKADVNALWCGPEPLGYQQLIAIRSFQEHGHTVRVWTYAKHLDVPLGTLTRDARQILPDAGIADQAFIRNHHMPLFQLMGMYTIGNWWTHLDVVCQRPLTIFKDLYAFPPHCLKSVGTYAMKAPAGCRIIKSVIDKLRGSDPKRLQAEMLLNAAFARTPLFRRWIYSGELGDDRSYHPEYFTSDKTPPPSLVVYHGVQSRSSQFVWPSDGSYYGNLLRRYQIFPSHVFGVNRRITMATARYNVNQKLTLFGFGTKQVIVKEVKYFDRATGKESPTGERIGYTLAFTHAGQPGDDFSRICLFEPELMKLLPRPD